MNLITVPINNTKPLYPVRYLLKPKVLMQDNLKEITKYWVVSPKLDGIRGILTLTPELSVFATEAGIYSFSAVSSFSSVLDVEKIGDDYYILDVLAVDDSPVLHKTLFDRIDSLDIDKYLKEGFFFQSYSILSNLDLMRYVESVKEGIVLQDPSLSYDPYTNMIYRVKREETIDLRVLQFQAVLEGGRKVLDVSMPDGIYEFTEHMTVVRSRMDKIVPNSEALMAKIFSKDRVTITAFQQISFKKEQAVMYTGEFERDSVYQDRQFESYADSEEEDPTLYVPDESLLAYRRIGTFNCLKEAEKQDLIENVVDVALLALGSTVTPAIVEKITQKVDKNVPANKRKKKLVKKKKK